MKDKLFDNDPVKDGGVLPEVGVIAHKSTLTGKTPSFGDKARNFISKVKEFGGKVVTFVNGVTNAGNADMTLNAFPIRTASERGYYGDYAKIYNNGQAAGHAFSLVTGAAEMVVGYVGGVGGGTVVSLGSLGTLSVPGGAMAAGGVALGGHGTLVMGTTEGNIRDLMAKKADAANGHPSTGGSSSGTKLTGGGKKRIGNLKGLKDKSARDALKERGGNNSATGQGPSDYWDLTVGEIANRAADGAVTVMKLIKQAKSKAGKY